MFEFYAAGEKTAPLSDYSTKGGRRRNSALFHLVGGCLPVNLRSVQIGRVLSAPALKKKPDAF
jgi:hypothetical protein